MDTSVLHSRELRLALPRFNDSIALKLGLIALRQAGKGALPFVVDIRTPNRILVRAALPGTTPLHDGWLERMAATAFAFDMSSLRVRHMLRERGESLATHGFAAEDHATRGGACPIRVRGTGIVGLITISGLSDAEDHDRAELALKTLLAEMKAPPRNR